MSSSSMYTMLLFAGSSAVFTLARRYVQQLSRRSSTSSIINSDDIPSSLLESYTLCPEEVEKLRSQYMSNSCSISYKNSGPLHITSGYKSRLVDVNGVEYLDTRNNVAHCGHGHPEITKAITYQMQQLQTNTRYLHPNVSLLAKKLSDLLPQSLNVVFFVNSGSEANDLALRLARVYKQSKQNDKPNQNKGKDHIITLDHAYHGHTLATLDVSPYKHRQGNELTCPEHVSTVPCPDVYRGVHAINRELDRSDTRQREMEAGEEYAKYVEDECKRVTSQGDSVSAFIMEGGMSVAGVILPPKSYLRRCIDAVHDAGGLYIADEVQTGFGRLGKCMWAFQYSNDDDDSEEIIPDIVTVGKPFGCGMPLAAVITTNEIASSFEATGVEYFNTFAGSPVCSAAGLSMLHVLSNEKLQENAETVGAYLVQLLHELQSKCELIGDIRGSGLFLGVELVRDKSTLEPATAETSFICSILKDKYKILTSIDGPHDNVIVIKPPMVFSKEDALLFVSCLEKALMEDMPLSKDNLEALGKTPT